MATEVSKYRPLWNRQKPGLWVALIVTLGLTLGTCEQAPDTLSQVKNLGKLVVATRNGPTVYYVGQDGPAGYEYELLKGFADYLGVELELRIPSLFSQILPAVQNREIHVAAAGLTVTQERQQLVRFGPPTQEITAAVIYRRGYRKPRSVDDLVGSELEVVGDSSHSERLRQLQQLYPDLQWVENYEDEASELTYRVASGELQYSVADSNLIAINRRYYPQLGTAFEISPPEKLAWAFHKSSDLSLVKAAEAYFQQIYDSGELQRLKEKHFGHVTRLDNPGAARFAKQIAKKLPKFEKQFKAAGKKYDFDWRFLAAVGYQESHWNPSARSPTGVRGLMMLTIRTAKEVGVKNRLDAKQSIFGGADYLRRLYDRLPDDLVEPDRSWMTLAAYNVGLGHLYDARRLAENAGDNKALWVDVRKYLPKLNQKKYFSQTRYGFARGREAVEYVENIRSYYDVLVWYTERDKTPSPKPNPSTKPIEPKPQEPEKKSVFPSLSPAL